MTGVPPSGPARGYAFRRTLVGIGLLGLAGSAAFGANPNGLRDRVFVVIPEAKPAAVSRFAGVAPQPGAPGTVVRSQPWWQQVTALSGTGRLSPPAFEVDRNAKRVRVKWSCQSGSLVIRTPGESRPIVRDSCPGAGTAYADREGAVRLEIDSAGAWLVQVDQQIDLPLIEPLLPGMTAPGATTISTGKVYGVEQVGAGTVKVYRLAEGGYTLRFDNFYVTPSADLEILLSPLRRPGSSREIAAAPSRRVSLLDVTAGSLNFTVPRDVDPTRARSMVVWSKRLGRAYAAASLVPAT